MEDVIIEALSAIMDFKFDIDHFDQMKAQILMNIIENENAAPYEQAVSYSSALLSEFGLLIQDLKEEVEQMKVKDLIVFHGEFLN